MSTPLRPRLPVLALAACALAVFGVAFARLWPFLLDDTFISARYAQHLVEGHGLVYNPGERVEGYTNFLWTLAMAIPYALGIGLTPFLKGASALLALATAFATWRLTNAMLAPTPASPVLRALPALVLLAMPSFVVSAADGLETMLFSFLLVAATARFLEEGREARAFPHSALLVALLAMTRPDGATFAALFVALGVLQRRPRRQVLTFVALFVAVFGAYFLLRAAYYGQWLPNTFYAKRGGTPWQLARGWDELRSFVGACGGWGWLFAVPLFARPGQRAMAWMLASVVMLRVAFHVWSGGAWMGRFRFLLPVLPILLALAAAGLAVAVGNLRSRAWIAALWVALVLGPGWFAYVGSEGELVDYGRSLDGAQGALGRRVAERTRSDAVMAMDDAGLGPLLARRRNVDMLGLNDTHIAHLPGRFVAKSDPAYVLSRRPDLIVLIATTAVPDSSVRFRLPGHSRLFREPDFQARYHFQRSYPFSPSYHLLVFRRIDSESVPPGF